LQQFSSLKNQEKDSSTKVQEHERAYKKLMDDLKEAKGNHQEMNSKHQEVTDKLS
jgi:hypothetical protein